MMKTWSIPAGRLFDTELRIHLTFFFLLAFVVLTESMVMGPTGYWRGLALTAIIFFSVLLHEVAHLLVSVQAGVPVRTLILLPVGGVSLAENQALPQHGHHVAREVRIALAGPLVSLLIAFAAGALVHGLFPEAELFKGRPLHSANLVRSFVWVNFYLGLLQLLPGYPLDGGRVLRAIFARRRDFVSSTRLAVTFGQLFAMLLIFAGLWNPWLMMTGFFLFVATQLEERTLLFRVVLEKVCVEDVMLTDFATLSPADTLEDALHKAVHSLQDDFPVVRGGDMVGVISRQKILDTLREGNAYVQSAMSRAFEIGRRKDTLAAALRKFTTGGLSIIPVVENERLVGIVTLQNLMHSMSVLAETRRLRKEVAGTQ